MRGFQNDLFYAFSITGSQKICILNSRTRGDFSGSLLYEISKRGDKISVFSKLVFKYLLCNIS